MNETLFLDNSSLELITTCPHKAYLKLIRRRTSAADAPALRLGGHLHAALAYRYKLEAFGKPWSQDKQLQLLERRFASTPCTSEGWRDLGLAGKVVAHYNEEFALETLDILRLPSFYNLPLVEKPFAIVVGQIGNTTIVYTGRLDLGIREAGRGIFVLDFKTTSQLGDSFWEDASVMEAQRGYCYALKECLGEEPTGYIIRAIAIRPPTRTGTSIEFKQQTFYTKVPGGQLDEWKSNMLMQVEEWLWHCSRNKYPFHHKHCIAKYGKCEFFNVCNGPAASRESSLMSSDFKSNDWSPMYR